MGLDAELVAIGRFTAAVVRHLDYPAHYYKDTRDGVAIITTVLEALTSQQSYELAACFGVEAFDFNRHHVDPQVADLNRLRLTFDPEQVEKFVALREHGFEFYYRPNG